MEKAGLIVRTRDANDERQVLISLTDKGKSLRNDVATSVAPAIVKSVGCGARDAVELKKQLTQLRSALEHAACMADEEQAI